MYTVEHLNNGHGGDKYFVHCLEVVPLSEVEMYGQLMAGGKQFVHCREIVLLSECPLSEVLLYMHVYTCVLCLSVCQLPCSRHGSCDQRTKRCRCDVFWMENPFTANSGRHESNCGKRRSLPRQQHLVYISVCLFTEWSVFYVVLIVIGVLVIIGVFLWLSCWCCLKKYDIIIYDIIIYNTSLHANYTTPWTL